jgi:hypothetical protein
MAKAAAEPTGGLGKPGRAQYLASYLTAQLQLDEAFSGVLTNLGDVGPGVEAARVGEGVPARALMLEENLRPR